ncbi:hypothetical protein MIND_00024800 [Mycena indigotica]|uniref:Uncharacterized protein n=1 Tax=Mycena indigotica TaxID=2126181 RepID=A0A8H6TCS8_9AGAR|nr:uncharacterized protein MIND_00024800 [Mycena indigotica]KAF7315105.1 hypothetical protein MIND_00024800 [Mycena indigotica]
MKDDYCWGGPPHIDSIDFLQTQIWADDDRRIGYFLSNSFFKTTGLSTMRRELIEYLRASSYWISVICGYFERVLNVDLGGLSDEHLPFILKEFIEFQELRFNQNDDSRDHMAYAQLTLTSFRSKIQKIQSVAWLANAPARQFSTLEDVLLPYGHPDMEYELENNDSDDCMSDDSDSDYADEQDELLLEIQEHLKLWESTQPPPLLEPILTLDRSLSDIKDRADRVFRRIVPWTSTPADTDTLYREINLVVDDLVWLRRLKRTVYRSATFQEELQSSGLQRWMYDFCQPGNLIEFDHHGLLLPFFRRYNWKLAYILLLHCWDGSPNTFPDKSRAKTAIRIDPAKGNAQFVPNLLQFISDTEEMKPWTYNPMAAFTFMSQAAFVLNWRRWIKPHLKACTQRYPTRARWKFDPDVWNPATVYNHIMSYMVVPRPARKDVHPDQVIRDEATTFIEKLDPRLRTIATESLWQRSVLNEVSEDINRKERARQSMQKPEGTKRERSDTLAIISGAQGRSSRKRHHREQQTRQMTIAADQQEAGAKSQSLEMDRDEDEAHTPSWWRDRSCPQCFQGDPSQFCVRMVEVKRNPNADKFLDYALTHAKGKSRLQPRKFLTKSRGKQKRQKYISPDDPRLQLKYYRRRHDVALKCGRDIVRFYYQDDGKYRLVGGVNFCAFSEDIMKILRENHRLVQVNGIRRRAAMDNWSHIGTMTGYGTRQPKGGVKGDIYNAYAKHSGATPEDLLGLMRHAMTLNLLVEGSRTIWSGAPTYYKNLVEESELAYLGKYGLTGYHCSNFVSCIHRDDDIEGGCLHPCFQLSKENCGPQDFNFAYVEWGVAIETTANALWLFDGRHAHGSIMPSAEAINAGAQSEGDHGSNNRRNVNRARTCRDGLNHYNLRSQAMLSNTR